MKKVTVYSTSSCPYCLMLKKWLNDKQINFSEFRVDLNPIAAQQMMLLSGQASVPFTTVEEDQELIKINGFDINKLCKVFGLT